MDYKVFIVKCGTYEESSDKISDLIEMMGGMHGFAKSGERIVLKVNLLREARPEEAVTTHPAVIAAVATLAKKQGAIPIIADSPGGGYRFNAKTLAKIYRTSGMFQASEKAKVELNWNTGSKSLSNPDGSLIKRFDIITPVFEADALFNLCKMKTHLFMAMTGAVKNIFGVIPGLSKPGHHAKLQDLGRFCAMLLDLANCISPRLSIMDAVMAMEGNGPGGGDPRQVGLLIGSESALALDVMAGEIMGIDRENNPILLQAEKMGFVPNRLEEIEIIGAEPADIQSKNFQLPQISGHRLGFGQLPWYQQMFEPFFKDAFSVRPVVKREECVACGTCIEGCPTGAVYFVDKRAFIDDDKCIRCYCCHEICPEKAVGLKRSWLYRLVKPV